MPTHPTLKDLSVHRKNQFNYSPQDVFNLESKFIWWIRLEPLSGDMFDARLVHRVTVYVSHRRRCSRRRSGNGASGSIRQVQGWGGGWRCGWGWGWGEESCRRSNLFPSHQCPYLSFTDTETEQIFRDFMNHACALMLWSIIYSGNIFPNIVDFIQRALIRYFMEHSGN